jgi:hypothetical protein
MPLPIIAGLLIVATIVWDCIEIPHPLFMWIMGIWMPIPLTFWGTKVIAVKKPTPA